MSITIKGDICSIIQKIDANITILLSKPKSTTVDPTNIIESVRKLRDETLNLLRDVIVILYAFLDNKEIGQMDDDVKQFYSDTLANLLFQARSNIYQGIHEDEAISNDFERNDECKQLFDDFTTGFNYQYCFKAAEELLEINKFCQMEDPITKGKLKMYVEQQK